MGKSNFHRVGCKIALGLALIPQLCDCASAMMKMTIEPLYVLAASTAVRMDDDLTGLHPLTLQVETTTAVASGMTTRGLHPRMPGIAFGSVS